MLTLEVGNLLQKLICHPLLILNCSGEPLSGPAGPIRPQGRHLIKHRLLHNMLALEVGHLLQELFCCSPLIISCRLLYMPSQQVAANKVPLPISRCLLPISPLYSEHGSLHEFWYAGSEGVFTMDGIHQASTPRPPSLDGAYLLFPPHAGNVGRSHQSSTPQLPFPHEAYL